MIQVNRIYLIFNRLVTKKFLVDTSGQGGEIAIFVNVKNNPFLLCFPYPEFHVKRYSSYCFLA